VFAELHPTEHIALRELFRHDEDVVINNTDGFALTEQLPTLPPGTGGLTIFDPSYEIGTDYSRAAEAFLTAGRTWPGGTHILWYPLVASPKKHAFLQEMLTTCREGAAQSFSHRDDVVLCSELRVRCVDEAVLEEEGKKGDDTPKLGRKERRAARAESVAQVREGGAAPYRGMYGSGLLVMNPHPELRSQLDELVPWLHKILKEEEVTKGCSLRRWSGPGLPG
jgi:23S rRNA A2030 N6-methylase RlmJ